MSAANAGYDLIFKRRSDQFQMGKLLLCGQEWKHLTNEPGWSSKLGGGVHSLRPTFFFFFFSS